MFKQFVNPLKDTLKDTITHNPINHNPINCLNHSCVQVHVYMYTKCIPNVYNVHGI